MKHSEQNKMHVLMSKFMTVGDWIMDHNKIVMPLVLVVCVLITIMVAVNANKREALEKEAEQAAIALASDESLGASDELEIPDVPLEENAHPEINDMVRTYYNAQVEGDIATITSLNAYLNEIETIRMQELSKYIDSYPTLNVYTKPGLEENTYVAYVCSEVLFTDAEVALPGMQTYYIGLNTEEGSFINDGTYDDTVWNYIKQLTLQDDVVDLNNKVTVEYNELLAEDEELNEFIAYLREKTNEDVGEILAAAEESQAGTEPEPEADEGSGEGEIRQSVLRKVKATDVVNIRSSDSEEADKIDKAQVGQEFTLVEQRENGWSQVRYNDKDAFIKSEYLELISEVIVDDNTQTASNTDTEEAEEDAAPSPAQKPASTSKDEIIGTVEVIESVKIRKGASTDSESLGTVFGGEILDVIMKQADGWTKIKYKGEIAYVKSEYVE